MKKVLRILAMCLMLVMIPGAAFASTGMITSDIESRSFVVGEWGEFYLRTFANDCDGTYVYAYYAFGEPEVVDVIEFYDESSAGWYSLDFEKDSLGPIVAFEMSDMRMRYRVKFNAAGNHSFGAIVVDGNNTDEILCFSRAVFRVEEDESCVNSGMHDVICSGCGVITQVPFEPRGDRPVYCTECFDALRS